MQRWRNPQNDLLRMREYDEDNAILRFPYEPFDRVGHAGNRHLSLPDARPTPGQHVRAIFPRSQAMSATGIILKGLQKR